jgi:hypothetical protein
VSTWAERLSFAPALEGWRVAGFGVDHEGNALVLAAEGEATPGTPYRARLLIGRGAAVDRLELCPLDITWPFVQRLPDDEVLVVDARCRLGERNALRIRDGARVAELCLGDGLSDVQTTARGQIWCGYFDEGVYGNLGWGAPNRAPIGEPGLVAFERSGAIVAGYDDSAGPIDDCYALNVAGELPWAYVYASWKLLAFGSTTHAFTLEAAAGAHAFAIDGFRALFAGGQGEEKDRLLEVELAAEPKVKAASRTGLPEGARRSEGEHRSTRWSAIAGSPARPDGRSLRLRDIAAGLVSPLQDEAQLSPHRTLRKFPQ